MLLSSHTSEDSSTCKGLCFDIERRVHVCLHLRAPHDLQLEVIVYVSMDARVVSEIAVLVRFGPRGSLKADLHSISVCVCVSYRCPFTALTGCRGTKTVNKSWGGKKVWAYMYWIFFH